MKKFQYSLLIFLLLPYSIFATHIIGGEISYQYLGSNLYQFKMIAYRDCFNGIPPFDNPAPIGIFDSSGTLISTMYATPSGPQIFSLTAPSCPIGGVTTICIERAEYNFTATLPPIPGGYTIAYQRCCLSNNVMNVSNVQGTGFTLMSTIPDSTYAINSSPVFTNQPYTYVCLNQLFTFDNSATEIDGDSISYSLYNPLTGGTQTNPAPDPPIGPPFVQIAWGNGYSLSNMIDGQFSIDSISGLLSGIPVATGLYLYGVCAKEFRNGVFLGETKREYRIYVAQFTGINETEFGNRILIYPNPVSHRSILQIDESIILNNARLLIYNSLGEIVFKTSVVGHDFSLHQLDNLGAGIYYYEFLNNGEIFKREKLVIEGY